MLNYITFIILINQSTAVHSNIIILYFYIVEDKGCLIFHYVVFALYLP